MATVHENIGPNVDRTLGQHCGPLRRSRASHCRLVSSVGETSWPGTGQLPFLGLFGPGKMAARHKVPLGCVSELLCRCIPATLHSFQQMVCQSKVPHHRRTKLSWAGLATTKRDFPTVPLSSHRYAALQEPIPRSPWFRVLTVGLTLTTVYVSIVIEKP